MVGGSSLPRASRPPQSRPALRRVRGAFLRRLRGLPAARPPAGEELGQRHVHGLRARPPLRAAGHDHGDDLRQPLHHDAALPQHGGYVREQSEAGRQGAGAPERQSPDGEAPLWRARQRADVLAAHGGHLQLAAAPLGGAREGRALRRAAPHWGGTGARGPRDPEDEQGGRHFRAGGEELDSPGHRAQGGAGRRFGREGKAPRRSW